MESKGFFKKDSTLIIEKNTYYKVGVEKGLFYRYLHSKKIIYLDIRTSIERFNLFFAEIVTYGELLN